MTYTRLVSRRAESGQRRHWRICPLPNRALSRWEGLGRHWKDRDRVGRDRRRSSIAQAEFYRTWGQATDARTVIAYPDERLRTVSHKV